MTDNIIVTERQTNDRQYNRLLYCLSFVFLSVAIILSVICLSFCDYYVVCHLFFFLWLLDCLSFVCLSVAIILSVICSSFCGYYIICHLFFFLWLLYCLSFVFLSVAIILFVIYNIIVTERQTNDRQYNGYRKKNK
jgi:hypothetical protein